MVTLPNGCYCSEFSVFPKNWKQSNASTKKDWYINYRFYDPTVTDGQGKIKPKQCIIKGMNRFKLLAERRQATQALMEEEMILLSGQGFNPITRQFMSGPVEPSDYEISPSTAFIPALKKALEKLTVTNRVRIGIKSIITGMDKAAMQLRFSNIEISKITRRHIKMMLEQCGRNSKQWSAARYNTYRGYLMMLYKELVELEAVPGNPIRDISKKPVAKRIKEVLSAEDRKRVNDHLANEWPEFQHFVHLFFHSGGRKTELLQLKPGMVDLVNQKYKCVVKKRRQYEEVERTIKTIAIPYWEYFLKNCPDDHFLFGPLFKPGKKPMGEGMPTVYWKDYVKTPLKITADLYSLKYSNTSEVVDLLDEQAAADLNAHTSTAMVVNIYDVKQKDRNHSRLKEVNNTFV